MFYASADQRRHCSLMGRGQTGEKTERRDVRFQCLLLQLQVHACRAHVYTRENKRGVHAFGSCRGVSAVCACARACARSPSISMTSKRCANGAPGSSLESHLPILFKAGRRGKTQTNNKRGVIQKRDRLLLCVRVCHVGVRRRLRLAARRKKYNEERGKDV